MSGPIQLVTAREPEPWVVDLLEDWLEKARAGEFVAVCVVGVRPGGAFSTNFTDAQGGNRNHLLAGVTMMQARILAGMGVEP